MKVKRITASLLIASILCVPFASFGAENKIETTAKGHVLMEAATGEILLEKNKEAQMPIASVTKVMTMLLIYEAIEKGKIAWDDVVTISEHAAHMGGSQVFMEPGEEQKVRDLVKCISIASANDAAVAMAEFIAGSESQFVDMMNQRAKELGMTNTVFKNACGLHEEGHLSTAQDVALMSRELITRFPEISETATIWMDTIIHKTRKGESEFGLTNTNKMLKWYPGITGLKTGYTPEAKHCVTATATRDNMGLIAVILGSSDSKVRFREAGQLLDYGFANYAVKTGPQVGEVLGQVEVKKGDKDYVELTLEKSISFVVPKGQQQEELTYTLDTLEEVKAPVYKGEKLGTITYNQGDKVVGTADVVAAYDVGKGSLKDMLPYMFEHFFSFKNTSKTPAN
jgi:D-alanyl-D-alanine carboxypeptidase (penicillin-binding protein 5/6)